MEIKVTKKPITVVIDYIVLGDKEFNLSEVADIMSELEDSTSGFSAVLIYDNDLVDALIECDAVFKNARGSCNKGAKFEELNNAIKKYYAS